MIDRLEPRRLLAVLASDQTVTGTIATGVQVDEHTITANAGDTFVIALGDTGVTAFDPYYQLIAPDNAVLQNFTATTGTVRTLPNIPQTGTYRVRVGDNGGNATGNYALTVVRVPATPQANPDNGAVTSGAYRTGTVGLGDVDVYTIQASAGATLVAAVGDVPADGFDPAVLLFGPTGAQLSTASGVSGTIRFVDNLAVSGTYYAVVLDSAGDEAGSYGFSLTTTSGVQTADGDSGPIVSGTTRTGALPAGDTDVYTITANQGGTLIAAVGETVTGGLVPSMAIYSPTGVLLGTNSSPTGANRFLTNLAVSGTYTIVVYDSTAEQTGNYALTVTRVPGPQGPDAEAGPTQSGVRRRGEVTLGDLDVFTIDANQGGSLYATLGELATGAGFDPAVAIYSPAGALLDSSSAAAGGFGYVDNLPLSGTYTVVVYDNLSDESGEYALTVVRTPGPPIVDDDSGPLASGVQEFGEIEAGDLDVYTFQLDIGDSVLGVVADVTGGALTPFIHLVGPNGRFANGTSSPLGVTASLSSVTAAGVYYVVVGDAAGTATGDYSLTVAFASAPQVTDPDSGPLAVNTARAGSVSIGDIDVHTLNLTQGVPYTITLTETATSGFDPAMWVIDPLGTPLALRSGAATASYVINSAPTTGTFTVMVYDAAGDESGPYSIGLNNATVADTFAPVVARAQYLWDDAAPQLRVEFTEDVQPSFAASDVVLTNRDGGQVIDNALLSIGYTPGRDIFTVTFPGFTGTVLPNGRYRLRIAAGDVRDAANNPMPGDLVLDFVVLAGDADNNGVVNFDDLLTLAQNYGRTGRSFSEGNFNYSPDGLVGFDDLLLLAQAYGVSLATAPAPALPVARRKQMGRGANVGLLG